MRRSAIVLTFCLVAVATAQSPRERRTLAGTYTTTQSRDKIERTLVLDRNGDFELDTRWNADRDREVSRNEVKRYGTTAEKAAKTRRVVKHVGRWEVDGGRLRLHMRDVIGDLKGSEKFDVDLAWRDGAFVFDKDTEAYGTERMKFRRDSAWPDNRPWRPGRGRDDDDRRPQ